MAYVGGGVIMLLKYLNKMNALHWTLVMVGLFAIASVTKVIAVIGFGIALLYLVVKYWDKVKFLLGGN